MSGEEVDFWTVTPWLTTAGGSCELAWPCRICARIWSVFGSVLTLKSTVRFIEPLLALREYMYSMLSTPDICCSMGVATDWSTVRASAPGYVAFTWTCGSAILGNCAMGRPDIATIPTITIRMEMTIATIGRLIKNLAINQGVFRKYPIPSSKEPFP